MLIFKISQAYLTWSWTDRLCNFRLFCSVNRFSQILQKCLAFPWTDWMWFFRLPLTVNCLSHWWQVNGIPKWLDSTCFFLKFLWLIKCFLHWSHWYLTPLCADWMCLLRFSSSVNSFAQPLQKCFTPLWTLWIWICW